MDTEATTVPQVISPMVGRDIKTEQRPRIRATAEEPVLSVTRLHTKSLLRDQIARTLRLEAGHSRHRRHLSGGRPPDRPGIQRPAPPRRGGYRAGGAAHRAPRKGCLHWTQLAGSRRGGRRRDPGRTRRVPQGPPHGDRAYDDILLPRGSTKTDWEVELGVVIGRTARYLDSPDDAAAHVAPYLIWYLSQLMVLYPGNLINTGTPAGVALGRPDHPYLRAGDVVELSIERLGSSRQQVKASLPRVTMETPRC